MLLTESNRQNLLLVVTVLSLVCFFSSFLLFVCAAYVKITIDSQMRLLETYNSDVLPAIFIAVGVINMGQNVVLVMVAFKLMTIYLRDSYVKSMKYILISGIVLVLFEVASAITSFVHISILDREFGEGISKAMNKYIEGGELKREIDSVQMEYACCGDKSYVDWFKYEWNFPTNLRTHGAHIKKYLHTDGKYYSDDTPFSCCDPRSPRPCIHHHIHDNSRHHSYNVNVETTLYVTGCRITLMAIYGKVLLTVGLVATLIACLKTTVLLLFRLLDTSLSKAQLLEDWEATTNAYIYKDDPNAESQSVKVKVEEGGDITEAETTEADTTEADTTEADITEADTTEVGEETATEASGDVNENQRLLKQQRTHRQRRRSFWDNRNVSCKSRDESPRSRRVTDELCQRFLNLGLMDTVMSDKSSVDRHIVDNIRQHMSRTSLASSGHHKYQFNNNCGIATFTEDSSVFNSSGEELQPHDCKTVQPLLSTNHNGPSKRYSKKLSDRCCNEIDVDVPTNEIHRSIHMSGPCVEQEYLVENELINGEQSMKHNNTITGRARRTKSNKSLSSLSNSSSSSTLSNSSSSTLPDSSSSLTSAVSSSSSFSSDSSSSSSESSSASLSSSTSSVSTSSKPETLSLSTSRPASSSWPSADIDDPLNERSSVATMAYTSSIRELGVWNGENCCYNNVNNGYIADPIHASHRYMTDTDQIYLNYGYLTDVDQKHVSNSYTKDVDQRYINQSYLAEINQSRVNHGYLTDINQSHVNQGYLTDINQSHVNQGYLTDINQSHVNQGYLTDINQSHVSYNNLTDVDHRHTCIGYLDELEMQECVLTSSGEKTVVYMSDGVVNGHQSITDVQQYLCPVSTSRSCQQIQETKKCWKNIQRNLNKHTSVCKYNSSEFSKQIVLSHFTDDQNCTYPTPRNDTIRSVDDVLKGTCNSVEPVVMDEDDLEVSTVTGQSQLLTNDLDVSAVTGQSQLLTNDLDVSAVTGQSQLLTNDCVDETLQISKDSVPASPIFKKAGVHVTSLLIKPQRTHIRSYCKLNNISTLPVITSSLFPAPIQSVCRSVRLTRPRSITLDLECAHLPLDLKKDPLTADQSYSIIGQCDSIVDRCDSVIGQCVAIVDRSDSAIGQYDLIVDRCDSAIGQYDLIVDRCDLDIGQCDSTMIQFDSTVNQCNSTSTDISCGIHSKTTNDSETVAKDILTEIVVVGDNKKKLIVRQC